MSKEHLTTDQRLAQMSEFEIFALDHGRHRHCNGCGGCILDPSHLFQSFEVWCVPCRDRIRKILPSGVPAPWERLGLVEWR